MGLLLTQQQLSTLRLKKLLLFLASHLRIGRRRVYEPALVVIWKAGEHSQPPLKMTFVTIMWTLVVKLGSVRDPVHSTREALWPAGGDNFFYCRISISSPIHQGYLVKSQVLIDTGASVSIFSHSPAKGEFPSNDLKLVSADGSAIKSYGSCILPVRLEGRHITWSFVLAAVDRPILGPDFLVLIILWLTSPIDS